MAFGSGSLSSGHRAGGGAHRATITARQAQEEVADLRSRVERLQLTCQALWEVVRDNTALEDRYLLEKIQDVALRDGRLDAKVTGQAPRTCSGCGKPVARIRATCLYCGAPVELAHPFDF